VSINGIYQFGTLTAKNGKVINFDEIDRDKDGKISQQEFIFIQKELCMDTVEFLEEDQQKDEKKVSDYEFILWQQEAKMQDSFDKLCAKVATEFIGENAKYSQQVLKELRAFMSDFISENKKSIETAAAMGDTFGDAIFAKYDEIKTDLLNQ